MEILTSEEPEGQYKPKSYAKHFYSNVNFVEIGRNSYFDIDEWFDYSSML